jgi:hypothetical protein
MKKRLLALILAFAMCFALVSCGTKQESNAEESIGAVFSAQSTAEETQNQVLFESDDLVNQLLCDYNDIAEFPFQPDEISRGNIPAKAIISSNDLYIVVVANRDKNVSISIASKDEQNQEFYPVFRDFATAINDNISHKELKKAWSDIQSGQYEIDYYGAGADNVYDVNGIQMQFFRPSTIKNESRVELYSLLD